MFSFIFPFQFFFLATSFSLSSPLPSPPVLALITLATVQYLRSLLSKMMTASKHRTGVLHEKAWGTQSEIIVRDDIRRGLTVLERNERTREMRLRSERREEDERAALQREREEELKSHQMMGMESSPNSTLPSSQTTSDNSTNKKPTQDLKIDQTKQESMKGIEMTPSKPSSTQFNITPSLSTSTPTIPSSSNPSLTTTTTTPALTATSATAAATTSNTASIAATPSTSKKKKSKKGVAISEVAKARLTNATALAALGTPTKYSWLLNSSSTTTPLATPGPSHLSSSTPTPSMKSKLPGTTTSTLGLLSQGDLTARPSILRRKGKLESLTNSLNSSLSSSAPTPTKTGGTGGVIMSSAKHTVRRGLTPSMRKISVEDALFVLEREESDRIKDIVYKWMMGKTI